MPSVASVSIRQVFWGSRYRLQAASPLSLDLLIAFLVLVTRFDRALLQQLFQHFVDHVGALDIYREIDIGEFI